MSSSPSRHANDGFATLRDPHVRAFIVGRMASALGTQFVTVAVGWELYERTNDPLALGLTGLFSAAPIFLLMIPAGHAADRNPRRVAGQRIQSGLKTPPVRPARAW